MSIIGELNPKQLHHESDVETIDGCCKALAFNTFQRLHDRYAIDPKIPKKGSDKDYHKMGCTGAGGPADAYNI